MAQLIHPGAHVSVYSKRLVYRLLWRSSRSAPALARPSPSDFALRHSCPPHFDIRGQLVQSNSQSKFPTVSAVHHAPLGGARSTLPRRSTPMNSLAQRTGAEGGRLICMCGLAGCAALGSGIELPRAEDTVTPNRRIRARPSVRRLQCSLRTRLTQKSLGLGGLVVNVELPQYCCGPTRRLPCHGTPRTHIRNLAARVWQREPSRVFLPRLFPLLFYYVFDKMDLAPALQFSCFLCLTRAHCVCEASHQG